jgi:SAM-dependent methyltransferase
MTSAAERFLVEFHARHTGATSSALAHVPVRCGDSAFNDSYDLLVAQVPADARRVLDLACGDGYLLSRLLGARAVEVTGVDMSAAELARADQNLQGRATLVRCRAQALPFSDKAFDVVTSHMALMLMDESRRVLSEIRRVLREAGRLAAVVGGPFPPSAAFEAYRALVNPHIAAAPGRVAIGDPQWRTAPAIDDLLRQAGFRDTSVRDVDGELELTPTHLWDWLMLMYDAHFLDPATRESIRGEFLTAMEAHVGATGGVRVPIRWMLVLGGT